MTPEQVTYCIDPDDDMEESYSDDWW